MSLSRATGTAALLFLTLPAFQCGNQDGLIGTNLFGDGGVSCVPGSTNQQGCPCAQGQTIACYTGDPSTRGVGSCRDGTQTCTAGALAPNSATVHIMAGTDGGSSDYGYGPCVGEVLPTAADSCTADAGACSSPVAAPRLLGPLSTSTVTSQQPRLRWELPSGTTGAHVEILLRPRVHLRRAELRRRRQRGRARAAAVARRVVLASLRSERRQPFV